MKDSMLVAAAEKLLGDAPVDGEMASPEIAFQACDECGYLRFPPAPLCPQCLNPSWQWLHDTGLGTVWSFCIYHRAFDPAFTAALPYNVALVELDSGPRLISNVLGIERDDLHIGLRVIAVAERIAGNRHLIYFRRAEGAP
jgi:uncharacterized OB-fold protein